MFERPLTSFERMLPLLWVLLFVLRLVLSGAVGLGDDEAYYWDWSRTLQASYYDHPGMTAWLIKLSTSLFGDTPFGVRLPFVLCNSLVTLVIFLLAADMFNLRTGIWAATFHSLTPVFALGGMLAVPDAPMGLAWIVVAWLGWRMASNVSSGTFLGAEDRISSGLWFFVGLALAFGIASKYTMILAAGSLFLFFFFDSSLRRVLASTGFSFAAGMLIFGALPAFFWNAQNDWGSFAYHFQGRHSGGGGANWTRHTQYWVSQAIMYSPVLFLLNLAVLGRSFFATSNDLKSRFIYWMAAPTFLLFTIQSLFAEFKPHWTTPAHLILLIGAARLYDEGFGGREEHQVARRRSVFGWSLFAFTIPFFVLFHVALVKPILPQLAQVLAPDLKWDPKFDPTNDLYGWPELSAHLKKLKQARIENGTGEPFLASSRYQLVSQLAFASGERVFRTSPERDHYQSLQTEKWIERLKGRPMLYVVDNRYERDPMTDAGVYGVYSVCAELEPFQVNRGEWLAKKFRIYDCR